MTNDQLVQKLNTVSGRKQFIRNYEFDDEHFVDLVMIHEAGIFLFTTSDLTGKLVGDDKRNYWLHIAENGTEKRIDSPYFAMNDLSSAFTAFADKFFACKTFAYTVFENNCSLKEVVSPSNGTNLIHLNELASVVKSDIKFFGPRYDNGEVRRIYKTLITREKLLDSNGDILYDNYEQIEHISSSTKQPKERSGSGLASLFFIIVAIGIVFSVSKYRQSKNTTVPQVQAPVANQQVYEPPEAYSSNKANSEVVRGEVLYQKYADNPNVLQIVIPEGPDYCFELKYDDGVTVLKFLAYGGKTTEVKMPVGTWRLSACRGYGWIDEASMFGEETEMLEYDYSLFSAWNQQGNYRLFVDYQ